MMSFVDIETWNLGQEFQYLTRDIRPCHWLFAVWGHVHVGCLMFKMRSFSRFITQILQMSALHNY